jgi:hypothetical protein
VIGNSLPDHVQLGFFSGTAVNNPAECLNPSRRRACCWLRKAILLKLCAGNSPPTTGHQEQKQHKP